MSTTSFIDPTASICGDVAIGEQNYIGPCAQVEARNPFKAQFRNQVNLQDNTLVSATTCNVVIGNRTSIAHGASVLNSTIGDFVFVGFNSHVENAVLEDGALVLHGARVIGVTIPKDRVVPPGADITSENQIRQLLPVMEANITFKDEVVSVNVEFADGYGQMVAALGASSVQGVGPKPKTSWESEHINPKLGENVILGEASRIIGNTRLGDGSSLGSMVSIRGDEGAPIVIGNGAAIGNKVTFHALLGKTISIGDQLVSGDRVVFHGLLTVGSQVSVGDGATLFNAAVGNHVAIGKDAIVVGVRLVDGARVPDGARVLDQATADALS